MANKEKDYVAQQLENPEVAKSYINELCEMVRMGDAPASSLVSGVLQVAIAICNKTIDTEMEWGNVEAAGGIYGVEQKLTTLKEELDL